jgi:hypothetical protein
MLQSVEVVQDLQIIWLGLGRANQRVGIAFEPGWSGRAKPWILVDDLCGVRYLTKGFADADEAARYARDEWFIRGPIDWYFGPPRQRIWLTEASHVS